MQHQGVQIRESVTGALMPFVHLPIEVICSLFVCFFGVLGAGIGWRKIALNAASNRAKQIASMHVYRGRLQNIVSELLSRANDLDQAAKYLPADKAARVSENVGKVCEELVRLGETLPLLDELLAEENIKDSKDGILRTCRMASKISQDMHVVEEQELKLIGYKKNWKKPHGGEHSG
jgi:hypothetical protein